MTATIENVAGREIESHKADLEPIRVRVLPDGRMDRENAAKYLGKKPKTLAMWQLLSNLMRWTPTNCAASFGPPSSDTFQRPSSRS